MRRKAEEVAAAVAAGRREAEARLEEARRTPSAGPSGAGEERIGARRRAYDEMVAVFLEAMAKSGKFGRRSFFTGRHVWRTRFWVITPPLARGYPPVPEYSLTVDGELYLAGSLDKSGTPTVFLGVRAEPLTKQVISGDLETPSLDQVQVWLAETLGRYEVIP